MAMVLTYDESHAGPINTIIATWTSSAGGTASAATKGISGRIIKAITDPSATAVPSINWDAALSDALGVNLLANCQDDLVDRHAVNTEETYFMLQLGAAANCFGDISHPVINGPMTIAVTNAGAAAQGIIYIYWDAGSR